MLDVITVGEALVEVMRPNRDQPLDRPGEFRGPFASGAPAIFAVAAARLGLSAGLIGGVGDDAFGRLLMTRMRDEGVDISCLQTVPGHSTGVAFVGYRADGSREFIFHLRHSASSAIDVDSLTTGTFSGVQWLHLSGSTLALGETARSACNRAVELILEAGGRITLDPNLRPELISSNEARQVLEPFLSAADLILPTAEEARALTGENDDDAAADALLDDRERTVVFKRGPEGCTVFTQNSRIDEPAHVVKEVDPTGAGDCFNAAFLFGLHFGWQMERVAKFANAAGALGVTKKGPMEGAPKIQDIEILLKKENG